jgi:hypothetical protein
MGLMEDRLLRLDPGDVAGADHVTGERHEEAR